MTQISEWLLLTTRNLGLQGATIVSGSEGYGHNRHIHSARFFELAENPQEIVIIVTEEEVSRIRHAKYARLTKKNECPLLAQSGHSYLTEKPISRITQRQNSDYFSF